MNGSVTVTLIALKMDKLGKIQARITVRTVISSWLV